jgi:hypothetical protein
MRVRVSRRRARDGERYQPLYRGRHPAPQGLSLTAKGNVLAQLRKPQTLVLLVYRTPKPRAHLKLLGRVALGQHPAGLSQLT